MNFLSVNCEQTAKEFPMCILLSFEPFYTSDLKFVPEKPSIVPHEPSEMRVAWPFRCMVIFSGQSKS